jgi:hypothetical protein
LEVEEQGLLVVVLEELKEQLLQFVELVVLVEEVEQELQFL